MTDASCCMYHFKFTCILKLMLYHFMLQFFWNVLKAPNIFFIFFQAKKPAMSLEVQDAHSFNFFLYFKHSEVKHSSPRITFMSFFIKCFQLDLDIGRVLTCMLMPFHYFFPVTVLPPHLSIALFTCSSRTSRLSQVAWHFQWNNSFFHSHLP